MLFGESTRHPVVRPRYGGLCVRGQRPPSLLVLAEYWQALKPEVEIDVIFLLQEVQIFLNSKSESYT